MTKKEQKNKKQEEEPGDLKKSANTNLPEATQELTKVMTWTYLTKI